MKIAANDVAPGIRDQIGFYSPLECAIARQEIVPINELERSRSKWWEFLARPTGIYGNLTPPDFVQMAYGELPAFRFDRMMCDLAIDWLAGKGPDDRVSVNVHPLALTDSTFIHHILRSVEFAGLKPGQICLELLENRIPEEVAPLRCGMERLKANGVLVAIDDFGRGAGQIPLCSTGLIEIIKIDRSLIAPLVHSKSHRNLLTGLVSMAEHTGCRLVAEGVESRAVLSMVQDSGLHYAQGFAIHSPEVVDI